MVKAKGVRTVTGLNKGEYNQLHALGLIKAANPGSGSGVHDEWDEIGICQILLFLKMRERGFRRFEASQLTFSDATRKFFESDVKNVLARKGFASMLTDKGAKYTGENVLNRFFAEREAEGRFPEFNLVFYGDEGVAFYRTEKEWQELYPLVRGKDHLSFNLSKILEKVIIGLIKMGEDPFGMIAESKAKKEAKTETGT
jgi:hypothetical protein